MRASMRLANYIGVLRRVSAIDVFHNDPTTELVAVQRGVLLWKTDEYIGIT
jgi:hypothetical protein